LTNTGDTSLYRRTQRTESTCLSHAHASLSRNPHLLPSHGGPVSFMASSRLAIASNAAFSPPAIHTSPARSLTRPRCNIPEGDKLRFRSPTRPGPNDGFLPDLQSEVSHQLATPTAWFTCIPRYHPISNNTSHLSPEGTMRQVTRSALQKICATYGRQISWRKKWEVSRYFLFRCHLHRLIIS
jgi:hypothetical protein